MTYNKKIDEALKKMNEDIKWKEQRQRSVRHQLIEELQTEKQQRPSRFKEKIVPAFSVLVAMFILTVIIFSEFGGSHFTSQNQGNSNGMSGDNQTQPIVLEERSKNGVEDNEAATNLLTQAEIMTAIKGQITSDVPVTLPEQITLPPGKHLTAVTSSNKHAYDVVFYQADEPIPINNALLLGQANPAEVIGQLHVEQYATQAQADEAIGYVRFTEKHGTALEIREALTGYQQTDEPIVKTHWNIGRWALTADSQSAEAGVLLAREVMTYLEEHMLPIPGPNGSIHLDEGYGDNQVIWQKETVVYTVDHIKDPFKALEIAVNMEK